MKFKSELSKSNKAIKAQRANMVSEDAKFQQEEILRGLQAQVRELEKDLILCSDMSPDSELSLKVVKDDFDAKAWAVSVQRIKVDLANKQVEMQLAQETYDEWFSDEK